MNFKALWDTLTWHLLIEIIAIIIAAVIVHPIISVFKGAYDWVVQKLAASNKRRAIKRIHKIFSYYEYISRRRSVMAFNDHHATLLIASDNLKVIVPGIIGALVAIAFDLLAVPVVIVTVVYVIIKYFRTLNEREYIVNFNAFMLKTQKEITALQSAANDDAALGELWRSHFWTGATIYDARYNNK